MNNQTKNIKSINKFIELTVTALAFLLPVFFLTTTTEFFELNKLALLTIGTIVLLIAWVVKFFMASSVNAIKSRLNLPFAILALVYILSAIFSLNPALSMFGGYARWFPSLFGFGTLIIFYYVIAANIKSQKAIDKIMYALLVGITLSSLIALLNYFGFYLGSAPFMQSPNFTLTGSATTTAVLAALAFIIALINLIDSEFTPEKVLLIQVAIVNFIVVGLYNIFPAWVILIVGILAGLYFVDIKKLTSKQNTVPLTVIFGVVVAVILVANIPQTRELIVNKNFGKEIVPSIQTSWKISSNTVSDFPLIGSGPSTFALNFTRYKPLNLNATDFWNITFDKSFNELFNILGSIGIIGTAVVLYLGIQVVKMALSTKKHPLVSTLVITMLALFFVTYMTVLTAGIFVIFLALMTSQKGEHIVLSLSSLGQVALISGLTEEAQKSKNSSEILQYLVTIPAIIFVGLWSFYLYKTYAAEYYMRQATLAAQQNNGTLTYQFMQRAIEMSGQRPEYRNVFAQTNIALANTISQNENINDTDRANVQSLVSQAIRQVRVSTEVLNSLSSQNWEVRANIYRALAGAAQNANEWAIGSYQNAIQLDPQNPRLRLELGGIYFAEGDYLTAANLFRQATNLKADYANAHYNLAQSLVRLENYDLARREFELVLTLVAPDSPDYALVQQEIDKLPAPQQAAQPTVEELDQQAQINEQEQLTQQEPLTNAGTVDNEAFGEETEQFDLNEFVTE